MNLSILAMSVGFSILHFAKCFRNISEYTKEYAENRKKGER
jgi:hypothetical protein